MGGPPNLLLTKHPRPLKILPPTRSYKFLIKRRGEHRSRDPLMDSGEANQHEIWAKERGGGRKTREKEGGGGGSMKAN